MNYLSQAQIQAVRVSVLVRGGSRRQDGYGNRIPTEYQVQLADKRWRRVYAVCWGNGASLYITVDGELLFFGSIDPRDHLPKES